jgi:hypothetical protein
MTWVWLGERTVDFGVPGPAGDGDERTVWLYADPFRVLGASPAAGDDEVRRAYRRAAREHHPDVNPGDEDGSRRFHEAQQALAAATGGAEVAVEPTSGDWWRFAGFVAPAAHRSLAVAGIRFELRDPHRVPLREPADRVRVAYAGQSVALAIAYSRSPYAVPLWRARIGAAVEYSVLVLLCVLLVPMLALLVAADLYVLSDTSALAAWASVLLIVGLGYGALVAILAGLGREPPTPRRAVLRSRSVIAQVRALGAGRTRPG